MLSTACSNIYNDVFSLQNNLGNGELPLKGFLLKIASALMLSSSRSTSPGLYLWTFEGVTIILGEEMYYHIDLKILLIVLLLMAW